MKVGKIKRRRCTSGIIGKQKKSKKEAKMTDENHEDSDHDSDDQQQEAIPEGEQDAPPEFVD